MPKFTYDDIVKAKSTANSLARPGQRAWVVAVVADRVNFPLLQFPPGVVYSIEFEDGQAIDIHEDDLEIVEKKIK